MIEDKKRSSICDKEGVMFFEVRVIDIVVFSDLAAQKGKAYDLTID